MLSYFNPKKFVRKFYKNERHVENKKKPNSEIHSEFLRYIRRKKRNRATNSFPFYRWNV